MLPSINNAVTLRLCFFVQVSKLLNKTKSQFVAKLKELKELSIPE